MTVSTKVRELKNYINGEWTTSTNKDLNKVINPATQEVIATAPRATKEETERAIQIAKETFESGVWSDLTAQERAQYLYKVADKIDERFEEIVELEVTNNGKIKAEAEFDIGDAADCFRYYAALIKAPSGEVYNVPEPMQTMV